MTTSTSIRRGLMAASFAFATLATAGAASAADLAVKAPPPPAAVPLDVHGFFDAGIASDFITARGQHLHSGATGTFDAGLSIDLYKNKAGFINKITAYVGTYDQLTDNTFAVSPMSSWSERDWWTGVTVGFAQNWSIDAQYYEIIVPGGSINRQGAFTLAYDDTSWGLPVQFKPYILGWYYFSGTPTAAGFHTSNFGTGSAGNGYAQLGANITWDLTKKGYGVTFVAPTYVSFGSKDFWLDPTNPASSSCSTSLSLAPNCSQSSLGVFSTGLTAIVPLTWMPKNYGNWAVKGGFQYFHAFNDAIVYTNIISDPHDSSRDYVYGFGSIGFSF